MLAVLKTAGSWPTSRGLEYATVGPDELARSAADWSCLPLNETSAAVRLLTLRPEDLRAEGIQYWLTEKRKYRATTRPLIEAAEGCMWIVPELATGTLSVLTRYMFDGRLPWPDLPGSLRSVLERARQAQNKHMERLLEGQVRDKGYLVCRGLTPWKARKRGLVMAPGVGEIDLLVADPAHRRLWVIEAKDPEEPFAPHELWSGASEFRTRYAYQLQKKAVWASSALQALLPVLFDLEVSDGWGVHALFVTSRVELAAFDERVPFPFVVFDDCLELLQSTGPPRGGLFVPDWAARLMAAERSSSPGATSNAN